MLRDCLIAAHAASATLASILGALMLRRPVRGVPKTFRTYLAALSLMWLFLTSVVATDWSLLTSSKRAVFGALLLLAAYMCARGWHAWRDLNRRDLRRRAHYVDDVGFTVISLFTAFIIVGGLDLGAPVWLAVATSVLGVCAGVRGLIWAKRRELRAA